jgi:plasmid maintenance system killer protein
LELAFADKEFRDLCLNESLAKKALEAPLAEKLKRRLADLAAASVVSDLFVLPGSPHELTNDRDSKMAIDLINGKQLIFQSGHVTERLSQSGHIDWSRVSRIKILGLENSYD